MHKGAKRHAATMDGVIYTNINTNIYTMSHVKTYTNPHNVYSFRFYIKRCMSMSEDNSTRPNETHIDFDLISKQNQQVWDFNGWSICQYHVTLLASKRTSRFLWFLAPNDPFTNHHSILFIRHIEPRHRNGLRTCWANELLWDAPMPDFTLRVWHCAEIELEPAELESEQASTKMQIVTMPTLPIQ